jgi:hypothetical protein
MDNETMEELTEHAGDAVRALERITRSLANQEDGPDFVLSISQALEEGFAKLANAITPIGVAPNHDATDGTVLSLTEAVMGITAGLVRVAESITYLADAVRRKDVTQ